MVWNSNPSLTQQRDFRCVRRLNLILSHSVAGMEKKKKVYQICNKLQINSYILMQNKQIEKFMIFTAIFCRTDCLKLAFCVNCTKISRFLLR